MRCGALYIATGEGHLREACASAATLKRAMPDLPIVLVAERDPASDLFERVEIVAEPRHALLDKVVHISRSPYERTLFLDTDTHICAPVPELFELLEHFDIAVAHDPYRQVYEVDRVPCCYPEHNTGVLVFRRSPAVEAFLSDWLAVYERHLREPVRWRHPLAHTLHGGDRSDQPAFREALFVSGLRVATLTTEYNCRICAGFVQGPVKILHGRERRLDEVAARLNRTESRRVFFYRLGSFRVVARAEPAVAPHEHARWMLHQYGPGRTAWTAVRRLARRVVPERRS